ncbi:MAG TPA: hypothetical protein VMO26_02075 [Vicinamibacterales bacterium]|nr:hypothetical protein [Vicinamibacterales bacterium]
MASILTMFTLAAHTTTRSVPLPHASVNVRHPHAHAFSLKSGIAARPVGLTIPIGLSRTATRLRPTGFYPHCTPLALARILVAVRIKPYSLG